MEDFMNSIICPIIRYDVLNMCSCPCMMEMGRNYDDVPIDENPMNMRDEEPEGYISGIYETEDWSDDLIEQTFNEEWRCDIYKKIGVREGKSFTLQEAERIGRMLGIDWRTSKFGAEQFRMGLDVELEHGRRDMLTNVTNDDPILTGKIALAHLNEFPDYYDRLKKVEQ